ncbi:DNA alkylation repair protein [candidate division GN15 bacterium]|nr:DNA alkylation repair protein [candidate division GN15 bacterium]
MSEMRRTAVKLIDQLEVAVAAAATPDNLMNYQQFHKEKLAEPTGLRTAVLRKISSESFRSIKGLPPKEILAICDELLTSEFRYRRFIAFDWASKIRKQLQPSDFARLERWLKEHVNDWGACDHLCGGPLGYLLWQYPDSVRRTRSWRRSRNRWLRRASAVGLIIPVRKGELWSEVYETAETLLEDPDDLVQKGYGWMLKEASKAFPDRVFDYVMSRRDRMPRTALRYAIEKLPPDKRRQAMARA